ncbi:MAG TPA: gas vesicle protein [Candidatus Limnocylindrales bacterium]|nr:gas vesicle protein [Candidatus Limnocylindrales bacterium]
MTDAGPVELTDSELTLVDLADRLLNRGVVLTGEATISVGGVDLVYLGLNLVLTSVETLEGRRTGGR